MKAPFPFGDMNATALGQQLADWTKIWDTLFSASDAAVDRGSIPSSLDPFFPLLHLPFVSSF